jgi:hypothetical protein
MVAGPAVTVRARELPRHAIEFNWDGNDQMDEASVERQAESPPMVPQKQILLRNGAELTSPRDP